MRLPVGSSCLRLASVTLDGNVLAIKCSVDAVLLLALELDAVVASKYARSFLDETVLSVFNQVIILNHFFNAVAHGALHLHGIQFINEGFKEFRGGFKLYLTGRTWTD